MIDAADGPDWSWRRAGAAAATVQRHFHAECQEGFQARYVTHVTQQNPRHVLTIFRHTAHILLASSPRTLLLAMSLNPEPSAPEERAEHNLPPKSYADAAEEALQSGPQSHVNGEGRTDEVKTNGIHAAEDEEKTSHEGIGQDGSPKSPTARGHRRVSSRSSHKSSKSTQDNQPPKDMIENHINGNGNALTTVKPSQESELPPQDRRTDLKRRDSELTAGRQAGASWSKSK